MAVVSIKHLFEAGAHLGHKTRKWHPKMKPYIFGAQSGIYIIDLRQTLQKLKEAYEHVLNISASGGKILFVGTKFQARDVVKEQALRSDNYFVNLRWLGGMLTNFSTIKQSITKLKKLEDEAGPDGDYVGILKKEAVRKEKERRKLENVLGGIAELRKRPAAVYIVDIRREFIALNEAKKLGIPVIAAVDTNCDFLIPGNDDSIHCIELFTSVIAAASIEGRKKYETKIRELKAEKETAEENEDAAESKSKPKPAAKKPRKKQAKTEEKIEVAAAEEELAVEEAEDAAEEPMDEEIGEEATPEEAADKIEDSEEEIEKTEEAKEKTEETEEVEEETEETEDSDSEETADENSDQTEDSETEEE